MKQDSTEPTSTTLPKSKPVRKKRGRPKQLTSVEYFAGIYMNSVLGKMYTLNGAGMNDLKQQAYEFGEFMVDNSEE